MKIGILTGADVRHRYFVNALRTDFAVSAVCYQDTGYVPAETAAGELDEETARIVKHHFDERRRQEQVFFGRDAEFVTESPECGVRRVDRRTLSTDDTLRFLQRRGVDAVAVYGTNLIKSPLLEAFAGRMLNMHLGLSPYYRGTATNFYPLLNDEPEYVGATIHLIDAGIDSGPIVRHARPEITADDMPHTVGCKAILAGIEAVKRSLEELQTGRLDPAPQWEVPNPRLYLRKDYHPSQVVKLYEMIDAGLFPRYAKRKSIVENAMRLME